MFSRAQLADGFRELGVRPGDVILLHASVRAVGPIAGGPHQIHLALKDALTADGTLMMYASCPEHYDEIGRGNLTPQQEEELLEKLPPFDPLTATSPRDNGALVEFFRTYPGIHVNHHVARFAVRGKHAEAITAPHPWNLAYGLGTPLDRFLQLEGKILLLGSDHDAVTFLHYAEHIADLPQRHIARFQVPIEENGRRVWRAMEEVDTSSEAAHAHWPDRFFALLVDAYLAKSHNAGASVGNAQSYLFPARGLLHFALPIMETIARDASAAERLLSV